MTPLYSALLLLMIKLEDAKYNPMYDKAFITVLTEVLRYFRDNGELKEAYKSQKDSLVNIANSPWMKLTMSMFTSKIQEGVNSVDMPDIDALIKESTSDKYIEKRINDVLGDAELKKE